MHTIPSVSRYRFIYGLKGVAIHPRITLVVCVCWRFFSLVVYSIISSLVVWIIFRNDQTLILCCFSCMCHWIGLRENLQETIVSLKYGAVLQNSLKPIQWMRWSAPCISSANSHHLRSLCVIGVRQTGDPAWFEARWRNPQKPVDAIEKSRGNQGKQ